MDKPPAKILFVSGGEEAVHRMDLSNGRDAKKAGHYYYEYTNTMKKGTTVPVTLEQLQRLVDVHLLKIL
jgi:hypothetical protein